MTMKKQDRKSQYCKIITALGKGDNKKAWEEVVSLAADDSGLFIFSSYEDVLKANSPKEVEL